MGLPKIFEHEPQVQADVGEDEGLEQHVDRVPHVALLQPGLVAGAERAVADDEPGDHDGQHAGCVQFLGRDERRERHHQPLHGLESRIGQPLADPQRHESQRRTDDRPEDGAVTEQQERVVDEGVGACDLGDRDREQRQRGGVVDEALAR